MHYLFQSVQEILSISYLKSKTYHVFVLNRLILNFALFNCSLDQDIKLEFMMCGSV